MDKKEILEKAKKKAIVGEMEKMKINSGNWIALIVAGLIAVVFMIVEGFLGRRASVFALATICLGWESTFYLMQFVKAKRPWQVLIGAVLSGLGFATTLTMYILLCVGVV